ncbi:MAG: transposase [Phormidesmis sp.]
MSNYRRAYTAGSNVFLTWVTYRPTPLFNHPDTVALLRQAVRKAKREADFQIVVLVILPDHLHFIWTLPPDDHNYSKRVKKRRGQCSPYYCYLLISGMPFLTG